MRPFYLDLLHEELGRRRRARQSRGNRYSLRAFARDIGIDPTYLSRLLRQEQVPDLQRAREIASALQLPHAVSDAFVRSVADLRSEAKLRRAGVEVEGRTGDKWPELDADAFEIISRLYHYAILELTYCAGFRAEPKWIAKYLGLTVIEVEQALRRLRSLGLLEDDKERGLRKSSQRLTTADRSSTTAALRAHQREIMQKSIRSLERDQLDRRCMMGLTIPIPEGSVAIAKKMIEEFIAAFTREMSRGEPAEVYQLGVSFYPLAGAFSDP